MCTIEFFKFEIIVETRINILQSIFKTDITWTLVMLLLVTRKNQRHR